MIIKLLITFCLAQVGTAESDSSKSRDYFFKFTNICKKTGYFLNSDFFRMVIIFLKFTNKIKRF